MNETNLKKYFDNIASSYSKMSITFPWKIFRSIESHVFRKILKNCDLSNTLELGSGTGFFSKILKSKGCKNLCVIDISIKMLDNFELNDVIKINSSIEDYTTNEKYSTIICMGVFEFCSNPIDVINKYVLMLKPGGCIIIMIPSVSLFSYFYKKFHLSHDVEISYITNDKIVNNFAEPKFEINMMKTWITSNIYKIKME